MQKRIPLCHYGARAVKIQGRTAARAYGTTVVLGSGWAGHKLLQAMKVDPNETIVCVSKNNHFLFTPLLTSTTVGTLEFRNVAESTLNARKDENFSFYHGQAESIDTIKKLVTCVSAFSEAKSDEENSERHYPRFNVAYDRLIIATGARAATFGIPGVIEYTYPLRQICDARSIRQRLSEVLERASSPMTSKAERDRLLSFVIVGGGPTSIEFAGELQDFIHDDIGRIYPTLVKHVRITLVEAGDRLLGSFDKSLSSFVTKRYAKKLHLHLKCTVNQVHPHTMELSDGTSLPFGLCVWSTGNEQIPFVRELPFEKDRAGRILVDDHLKVIGQHHIYAAGDCSALKSGALPGTAQVANQQGLYMAKVKEFNGSVCPE